MLAISLGEVLRSRLFKPDSQPRAQRAQFDLVSFEKPQAGSQGFTDILVAAGRDQPSDELGLRVRQDKVSGHHETYLPANPISNICQLDRTIHLHVPAGW